ncbi:hypothetical protein NPIL_554501 [Nephila pilipes]|uniref:Uncharacterized protein n=1 Tax=Nephila pilipes TaxID=299642 RepID=A0A8X6TWF0_NEPPI|nr:hypothetical protein NPIL_554501 [Nephila pilipes]
MDKPRRTPRSFSASPPPLIRFILLLSSQSHILLHKGVGVVEKRKEKEKEEVHGSQASLIRCIRLHLASIKCRSASFWPTSSPHPLRRPAEFVPSLNRCQHDPLPI